METKKEIPIVMALTYQASTNSVEKKCFYCNCNVYPCIETIEEVKEKYNKKIIYSCPPCTKKEYKKNGGNKIGVLDTTAKHMGLPKEILEMISLDYFENEEEGAIAG